MLNNSIHEMPVILFFLPRRNRTGLFRVVLVMSPIHISEQIEYGHGGIEMEIEGIFVSGLPINKAGKLFGISEEEFNLKTGLVKV